MIFLKIQLYFNTIKFMKNKNFMKNMENIVKKYCSGHPIRIPRPHNFTSFDYTNYIEIWV